MTDSIRQRIISAVDTRFKTILVAGGFKTNMGQHIFEWKTDPFQASEVDGLTYNDRTEQREVGCGIYDLTLPLEIEIASTTPAQVRKCLADLEKAIHVDLTWGSLAFGSDLDANEMVVEKKEHVYTGSKITMNIYYRTLIGDPDTQA